MKQNCENTKEYEKKKVKNEYKNLHVYLLTTYYTKVYKLKIEKYHIYNDKMKINKEKTNKQKLINILIILQ